MKPRCQHCGKFITEYKGLWWTGTDFMCPDGEQPHEPKWLQVWLRGILCNIIGYVEKADWSVGITADSFVPEIIIRADNREPVEVSDSEIVAIESAYFDSLSLVDGYYVFDWQEACDEDDEFTYRSYESKHKQWLEHWLT